MFKINRASTLLVFFLALPVGGVAVAAEVDRENVIDLEAPVVATVGDLEFRECRVSDQVRERKVQCAWYEVAENPKMISGDKIKLFVVRLPAKRTAKDIDDPVLFVAGGPGQAASEGYLFADLIYSALNKKRDFYLIDQRGTGYSNYMGCEDIADPLKFVGQEYDSKLMKELTEKCLAEMTGNPQYYTTDISVQDFEKVRDALGLKQWNLLGVSYGTRVSTHYMRRAPESVRSVVLDSVVPPDHVLVSEIALRSQRMLDVLTERCQKDELCSQRIPNLEENFRTLFTKLEQAAIEIEVENFTTGEIESVSFSEDHLIMLVRLYLYRPATISILPPMIKEAAESGNFSPLARAARDIITKLQNSMSPGLHNSVVCTEEYPYFSDFTKEQLTENQKSYMGTEALDMLKDVCSVWPRGEFIPEMKDPLKSKIPTLLLSGEYDPITPPEYADQTAQHLSQSKHLVLKGQGHYVSVVGCTPHLIEKFVSDKSSQWLDTTCLERLSAQALFLNFNGTGP